MKSSDPTRAQPHSRLRLLLRLVSLAVGAALIALVIKTVPWRDSLNLRTEGASEAEIYPGVIEGRWRSPLVRFRFDPVTQPGPTLAGSALAATAREGGLVIVDFDAGQVRAAESGEVLLRGAVEARPGMPRAFGDLDLDGVPIAILFLLLASLFIVTRWWRLLLIAECPTSWLEAFRLTYVGMFFNTILLGSTGGDLVRAYVVVRGHTERRAAALTSVGADRVIGLIGMALLSAIAIETSDQRFARLAPWVLFTLALLVGAPLALVNPWLRRLVRFDSLLPRLPQGRRLAKIDQAVRTYASRPGALGGALLLSMGNHLCATACCYAIGHALGDTQSFHDYICIVTVANAVSSIPLSPGGLGVGEVAFGTLLSLAGGLYMIGVATSLLYRLGLALLGLGGGIVLLLPGGAQVRSGYAAAFEENSAAQES